MNMELLFETHYGCAVFAFAGIYFLVNCCILYIYFFKGERRLYLHKILVAFASFFLLGIQELIFHLCCTADGAVSGSISLLNVKLFIYSSLLVIMLFQSAGFIEDGMRYCLKYQLGLAAVLLFMDFGYYNSSLYRIQYSAVLSGLMIILLAYIFWRFSVICLSRYDTIIKTMDKKIMAKTLGWFGITSFISYMVLVSLIMPGNVKCSVFTLMLIMTVHGFFVYKYRNTYPKVRRSYVIAEDDESNDLLMEEAVTEDFKIIQRLVSYFEQEKPYLNKEIKIGDVAKRIYTNKTYLSRALNQRMFKNFSQFVNYYRVKEACNLFLENPLLSLNDMCSKSGFKNTASFSSSFNLNLRYTPSEWCKEIRGKIQNNEEVSINDYFI